MIFVDLLWLASVVIVPAWVSHRIFSNNPDRPLLASWVLAVIGGPLVYSLLALIIFAVAGVGVGGMFGGFLVVPVSLITATLCAVVVKPTSPHVDGSPGEEQLNA